ncbi:MAG TPA: AAA family ATPase [Mycobacteriales bacterium]|nr:AAA family ATPase [Mycobacteriales bacterium]
MDPSILAALEAAVGADQGNHPLRLHLAHLLDESGRHRDALAHASTVLQVQPDNLDALRIAASAAGAVGEGDRAAGYRRLAAALEPSGEPAGPSGEPPRSTRPRPAAVTGGAEPVPDTAEELFERWRDSESAPEPDIGTLSAPGMTLDDVGGMAEVKRRLDLSFLAPLRNPQLRARFGKSLRGGLLLWGPPGCGKTYIARALAGELAASFYEIGLSDVLDMWVGSSERNLSTIFDTARRRSPCLLFFDEIDALGHKRSALRGGGVSMRGVVNQFLAELDGATTDNEGVFVLAATNHPWDVDPALLRPGRFDRSVLVLPPTRDARRTILELHLRGKPVDRLDLDRIAKLTDGMSGADLALLCDHATERAMEASMKAGSLSPITQEDLLDGVAGISSSVGPWLETARNYALFANDSGNYDELADYLRKRHR